MRPVAIVSLTIVIALACGAYLALSGPALAAAAEKPAGLRHVVLFKFKDSATPENVATVEKAFAALPKNIDVVRGYEWGTNVSPENLNQGYTHCFLLTFDSARDRDAYLVHPAHKEFGKLLGPYLDKVTVVDFEPAK
jgi:hypothetical protein